MGLELVISIMIIGAGVTLLFFWLGYAQAHHLSAVSVTDSRGGGGGFLTESSTPIYVWVLASDEHGAGLPGVAVTLAGGGTGAIGTTGSNGSVELTFSPAPPTHSPYVDMTATGTYTPPASVGSTSTETATTSFVVYLA